MIRDFTVKGAYHVRWIDAVPSQNKIVCGASIPVVLGGALNHKGQGMSNGSSNSR